MTSAFWSVLWILLNHLSETAFPSHLLLINSVILGIKWPEQKVRESFEQAKSKKPHQEGWVRSRNVLAVLDAIIKALVMRAPKIRGNISSFMYCKNRWQWNAKTLLLGLSLKVTQMVGWFLMDLQSILVIHTKLWGHFFSISLSLSQTDHLELRINSYLLNNI